MSSLFRPRLTASSDISGPSKMNAKPLPGGAAGDAAAAAEFAAKKYVWIPDKEAGYLSAWVVREEDGGEISVCSLLDGQMRSVPTDDLSKMNPPKFDKVGDIADLTFLNEASVVHNLRQRFFSGLIYTYSGLFLVAVNPYHSLPLYTDAIVASYKGRRREENAPHVYALADGAMRNMLEARENQSLLITGESGAGKTENTKKVIQYLAAIAIDPAGGLSTSNSSTTPNGTLTRSFSSSRHIMDHLRGMEGLATKKLGLLERQILQANPILEAFGNAQTIRNNNSSRFGKFVRIEFTSGGAIAGANIDWYLLEKSRVTNRSEKERSFHIFYQLLRGADEKLKSKLLLTSSPEDYDYLKATRKHVEGVDDALEWKALLEALTIVGFTSEEQTNIFRVIAAILQVGNIQLADDRSEQARIINTAQLEKVCHVLGLSEQELTTALLRPKVKAGREWVTQSRTRRQVIDEMASLCKTLYEKTFSSIVDRINKALDRPTSKSTFIGVLDIAGFEIFETNSFEQLCINYTNEKLQQFFNHHMFVLEQEEYARESIDWDFVNFGLDLQPTIDLIESTSPIGILSCLDEECIMPKATDLTFTEKLNRSWSTNKDGTAKDTAGQAIAKEKGVAHGSTKYVAARFAQGFTIKHYAGNVEYRTDGWLDKNKDPLNDNLTRIMSESTDRFVASLFAEYAVDDENLAALTSTPAPSSPPKRRMKRGAFRTVAQRHKEQLNSLMSQLQSTQPHFVRCIVPNSEKKPGKMDVPLVLEQLRCNGVLEGIRIARLGYPNRLLFTDFRNRYEVLTPGVIPQGYMDGRKACQTMVEALQLDKSSFKVGLTKVFFKAGVLADMEEKRDRHLHDIFARFQAACRMYTARRQMKKILNRAAAVRTIQRNARLYVQLREWPWWQMYSKVRPLLKATRHDEELKRNQHELALVTERAERDQKEKEALEALKFSLESDKKRVEAALESERALLIDKDQQLARSKERESTLEEEVTALQAEVDQLDSQLERAMTSQRATEQSRNELKTAFDAAAEHLIRFEAEQKIWKASEAQLVASVGKHTDDIGRLQMQCKSLQGEKADLDRAVLAKEQDVERVQKRMKEAIADVEMRLQGDIKSAHETADKRFTQMQADCSAAERARRDVEGELQAARRQITTHEASLMEVGGTLTSERALLKEKDQQLARSKERESALEKEVAALQAEVESANKQHTEAVRSLGDTQSIRDKAEKRLSELQAECTAAERAKRDVEGELQTARRQITAHEASLIESRQAKTAVEQHLTASNQKYQDLEDALLELERSQSAWKLKAEQVNTDLMAESKKREMMEIALGQHESHLQGVEHQYGLREQEIAALKEELSLTQAELKKTQSMTNKTIVEHVHVLEEAKKYTDRQLQDAQRKLQELAQYTKTLEKSKARLVSENEDLSRDNNRLQLESRGTGRGVLTPATNVTPGLQSYSNGESKMVKSLESKVQELSTSLATTRRERDEAQSNYRRKDLQMDESLSRSKQQYESRIAELEKELRGTQMARSTTYQILTDLVDKSNNGDDSVFRQKLLRELQTGHDELEQDIAEKAELLRNYQMNGNSSPTLAARLHKPTMSPFAKNGSIVTPSSLKRASMDFAAINGKGGHPVMGVEERAKAEKKAKELQMQLNALVLQVDIMNEVLHGA